MKYDAWLVIMYRVYIRSVYFITIAIVCYINFLVHQ